MELTATEKRIIAIAAVGGRVNREEFNTMCNTDNIHKGARDRALSNIREQESVQQTLFNGSVRYDGDSDA